MFIGRVTPNTTGFSKKERKNKKNKKKLKIKKNKNKDYHKIGFR